MWRWVGCCQDVRYRSIQDGSATSQPLPHRSHVRLIPNKLCAGLGFACWITGVICHTRIQHGRLVRVAEEPAVAGVQIALGRQTLREEDLVLFQLDVEILDRL